MATKKKKKKKKTFAHAALNYFFFKHCHEKLLVWEHLITCESDATMLIAPMSCNMSSAAMVSARIRDSANATSSLRFLYKTRTT